MSAAIRTLLCAAAVAAAAGSARAAPQNYQLDPTHSFATWEVLHFGTSTIRGRLGPLNGQVTLDREAKQGRVQVVIELAQQSTGLPVLDARLKEPDMLALQDNPQAFFVAERFEFDAQGQVTAVRGEFTLRGQGQPLTLSAQRFRCYTSPLFRREVCGGDFEGEFKRSSYGITHSLPFVADVVRLKVQVEGIVQP